MEITVNQSKLNLALSNVSRVAGGRTTLPVLNNVLIRVEASKVALIATNLDMAIINYLPTASSQDGVATLPAKLLAEYVSNLPKNEQVTLNGTDNNKVSIKSGRYSSIMNATSAEDFPELPEIDTTKAITFKMGVDEFKNGIESVIIATSKDTVRPALTGVYFVNENGNFVIVGTDGYRFCHRVMIKNIESDFAAIVPAATLSEVLHSIGDDMEEIEITISEDLVRFRMDEIEIVSKLLEGSYPEYQNLIPSESPIKATVDREDLIRIVKLAAIFAARATTGAIICETKLPDTFSVSSITSEVGENAAEISAEITKDAKITLNARFLMMALNTIETPKVNIEFNEKGRTIVLKNYNNNDYIHVIMSVSV